MGTTTIYSVPMLKLAPDQPLTVGTTKELLDIVHPDCIVKIKIGDALYDVREIRHVATGTGEPILRVFVPVDFTIPMTTK